MFLQTHLEPFMPLTKSTAYGDLVSQTMSLTFGEMV